MLRRNIVFIAVVCAFLFCTTLPSGAQESSLPILRGVRTDQLGGVSWGDAVQGLQAGLMCPAGCGDRAANRISIVFFVRNAGAEPKTISGLDPSNIRVDLQAVSEDPAVVFKGESRPWLPSDTDVIVEPGEIVGLRMRIALGMYRNSSGTLSAALEGSGLATGGLRFR